jgi:hypothetical protein
MINHPGPDASRIAGAEPVADCETRLSATAAWKSLRALLAAALIASALLPVPASAQGRLWRANLADAGSFLPTLRSNAPDTSLIRIPAEGRLLGFESEAAWNGILDREEDGPTELLSAGAAHSLWARPLDGTALGLSWRDARDRSRHVEPGELDARLGGDRRSLGVAWVQSLLPHAEGQPFVDAGVLLPDLRRQGHAWMLAGGREGVWRLEYGFTREEVEEEAVVTNLDTAGNGEEVRGLYKSRVEEHRLLARMPAAGGEVSVLLLYGTADPRRPEREFWFCDSSRRIQGRLAYGRSLGAGAPGGERFGAWRAWAEFQEAEAYSMGRRIPPGSEGVKRYHFARNHAVRWEAGAEAGPAVHRRLGWRTGAAYRRLSWSSEPPDDALESRRETLSYNRLGLSFIANLYGGLFKLSEMVSGEATAGIAELDGDWRGRLGPVEAGAGLSLYRTGFDLEVRGHSLAQRLIVVDTSGAFRKAWRGWLVGATPRLFAAADLGFARLEAEAAQALPLHVEVRRLDENGSRGVGDDEGARYRLFRNGFAARARLVAGF